jgi:hypothetical protein
MLFTHGRPAAELHFNGGKLKLEVGFLHQMNLILPPAGMARRADCRALA